MHDTHDMFVIVRVYCEYGCHQGVKITPIDAARFKKPNCFEILHPVREHTAHSCRVRPLITE